MDAGVLAPLIPIAAIVAYASIKIAGIVARPRSGASDPDAAARFAALEEEMGAMRRQLEEAHERLDFTERLLAKQHAERLPPPPG
jgi:hypothetical protein